MNQKQHKILIVCGFFPYPPMHGGMVDVWKRIEGIKELGHTIDLVYTAKEKPLEKDILFAKKYIRMLFEVSRKNRVIDIFSSKPLQVTSRSQFKNISIQKQYDFVILEGDYVGEFIKNTSVDYGKLIIRSHNNESIYFKNLSKSTSKIFRKIYYWLEHIKFRNYTKEIYSKANTIWFISKEDTSKNRTLYKNKVIHLPPPFSLNEIKKQNLDTKKVLFVGSLFMDNNIEAILWYLKNIHNEILKYEKDYEFIIAGSLGNKTKEVVKKSFNRYKNIQLYMNCESLDEIYEQASIFVNPMLHGAGVKIKSIQAAINGLPLVSTTIGVEGIGLQPDKDFLLANDRETFTLSVLKLLKEKNKAQRMVDNAQQFLRDHHYIKLLKQELNADTKNI
ncbi:glycosyltransferase family 4 protein [Tenacibaculum sp. TC6]|uniref:glycosyltransferase family 4 protein n=1 Tax=Tenacibaculum sp. TC6 TaxID=3423223 RepID=UPI003D362112